MTDQGWMIDDGTCLSCVEGQCYLCTNPHEEPGDPLQVAARTLLICCCDQAWHIGHLSLPEEVEGG